MARTVVSKLHRHRVVDSYCSDYDFIGIVEVEVLEGGSVSRCASREAEPIRASNTLVGH